MYVCMYVCLYVCMFAANGRPNQRTELAEIWHAGLFWANLKHGGGPVSKFWILVSDFGLFWFFGSPILERLFRL